MDLSFWAGLYEKFGVSYPLAAYTAVFLLGGLLASGAWWMVGDNYRHQQAAIEKSAATDREVARLGTEIRNLQGTREEAEQKKAVREVLGRLMDEGRDLLTQCAEKPQDLQFGHQLEVDGDAWYSKTLAYLQATLDSSFGARFEATRPDSLSPVGVPAVRYALWHGIDQRVQSLREFIGQLN